MLKTEASALSTAVPGQPVALGSSFRECEEGAHQAESTTGLQHASCD